VTEQQRVARNFFAEDGRLHTIPSMLFRGPRRSARSPRGARSLRGSVGWKHSKLLVVLDRLAQEFVPGQTYPEAEVNDMLNRFHPDHAALRRYLVENAHPNMQSHPRGRLGWRSGGTFEV
jgi:hypothetical protein